MSFAEKSRAILYAGLGGAGIAFLTSVVGSWLGGVLENVFQIKLVSWEMASLGIVFLSTLGGFVAGALGRFIKKWFFALVSGLGLNGLILGLVLVPGNAPLLVNLWGFATGSLAGGAAATGACLWYHQNASAGIAGNKKTLFIKLGISLPMFLLTAFCLFGFQATKERPGSWFLQIFYLLLGVAALVVGIFPFLPSKKKP